MAEWQEVLINLMREKPILYDKSHPDYKDSRNKKRNHWQDVLDEFNKITDLAWDKCKPIDLSYVFDNETMYWGDNKRFNHPVVFDGPLKDGNETIVPYLSIYEYEAAEHGGTHMDAPIHFAHGKWTLDVIPIENFIGDAVVVNISIKASTNRSAQLTVQDLKDWENVYGAIPNDCIMFVYTGYGKYWLNNEKYFGTNTTNPLLYTFPGIHEDAARWLVQNRKIKGIGIDTPSIDYGKSRNYISHQILLGENIYALENVAYLDQLPATGYVVYCLPMKIGGGSGGPTRIIAMKKESGGTNDANVNSLQRFIVMLLTCYYIFF